ncbi:hypothetical protein RHMOL_Rhmol09G0153700 [Rhododendron molle]|uniref:Uncharacterized protein n=1 Tax=Rhododendron molle TaxID=49168 RepID=A0ACC0ME11_RHOML|nr:hypothetical protein RHMOL_Rhmol09G0153700 [Rhododendron molle]
MIARVLFFHTSVFPIKLSLLPQDPLREQTNLIFFCWPSGGMVGSPLGFTAGGGMGLQHPFIPLGLSLVNGREEINGGAFPGRNLHYARQSVSHQVHLRIDSKCASRKYNILRQQPVHFESYR